jgi:hypothetical protein
MRTTLDIEDDVLRAAKDLAERENRSMGKVLSDLARRGLASPNRNTKNRGRIRSGVPVLPSRGEIVTLRHVEKIRDAEGV